MKKALLASTLLLAGAAQADTLGVSAEVGRFSPDTSLDGSISGQQADTSFNGESNTYYGIAFEHPVPLVPNVRLQGYTLEGISTDVEAKIDGTDLIFYYQLLDGLAWLSLDAGLSVQQMDVKARVDSSETSQSVTLPTGYLSAYFSVPSLPIKIGAELKTLSVGNSSINDTTFKIKYTSPFLIGMEGGYRDTRYNIDEGDINADLKFDGVFVGVTAAF